MAIVDETNHTILKQSLLFWEHLTEEQEEVLLRNIVEIQYQKGQAVYSATTECTGVLVIKAGELRTFMLSEDGREITLYRLSSSDVCILSASCLIKNITFDIHIEAEADTEILMIDIDCFSKLISENIYVENFSLKATVEKFSDVMWTMEQILFMSMDRRLAIFLLDECARNNSNTIKLTQVQIAKYIGSAREVVSRTLKYFVNEKIVYSTRNGIEIIDKAKLKKLI